MGLSFPAELRYADSHEYAGPSDDGIKVGISAFAVDQLGDIVLLSCPRWAPASRKEAALAPLSR